MINNNVLCGFADELEKIAEKVTVLSPDATERIAKRNAVMLPLISSIIPGVAGAGLAEAGIRMSDPHGIKYLSRAGRAFRYGAPVAAGLAAYGLTAAPQLSRLKSSHKYERAQANKIIRLAKQQGYEPVMTDKWSAIDRSKVRAILRNAGRKHQEEAGVALPSRLLRRKGEP